jgi:diguanylate cyclase (GGDEF)-like protein/PAS domain S-box-containing protein
MTHGNQFTGLPTSEDRRRLRYYLPAVALLLALPISKLLSVAGPVGIYSPIVAATVICAWFGGVVSALLCEASGALILFSFFARPSPLASISSYDAYEFATFLAICTFSLFFTAHIRWARDLHASERSLQLIATATNDTIWNWDVRTDQVQLSGNLHGVFGHPGTTLRTTSAWWRERIHADDAEGVWDDLQHCLARTDQVWSAEYRVRRPDGSSVLVADRGTVVRDRVGRAIRMIGGVTDITAMRNAQERLEFNSLHDALTGLSNRQSFRDRLHQTLSRKQTGDPPAAVLFVDLDRFKAVNDSLGHAVGDKLLRAVAKRIELSLRPGDLVARFGGDEFTILLEQVADVSDAIEVAKRLLQNLTNLYELEGHSFVMTASIGIALASEDAQAEDALRHADVAMYRAKAHGRARYEVFESVLDARRMNLVQMESEMRKGLADGDFRLYYQPIVNLRHGKLRSVEALIRWQHRARGLLLPSEFLPLAEESGLIVELGSWVLETACRDLSHWRKVLPLAHDLSVSVNIAHKQFADRQLAARVQSCLERDSLSGDALVLELTENIILDSSDVAVKRMKAFRELGIRFAVDDFGKGHSSLARVHELPISILKIDGSFVKELSNGRPALVNAIVALAHELELDVTAECIETPAQAVHLRRLDCTAGQGKLFSGPLEADSFLDLARSDPHWHFDDNRASGAFA